ncbi:MAG: hypothetical protein M3Q71_02725 [Chloroflexota bacterium]|nr:hypothetical protein [Chloroflexota bacterium]MDP9469566.1 hypothetical protein [Chloroflexota bacterium]
MDTVEARITRHRLEDLHRLAAKAEKGGSRILHVAGTSNHVATSASSPVCYQVSVAGCSCRGFATWGRCGHWALLLSELGRLPDLTDTVVEERPAPCRSCRGTGFVRMTTGPALSDWVTTPCTACSGHPAPSPSPVAVCAA